MVSNTDDTSATLALGPAIVFKTAVLPVNLVKMVFPNAVIVPGRDPEGSANALKRLAFR